MCGGYQIGTFLINEKRWNPKLYVLQFNLLFIYFQFSIIALGGGVALIGIFISSFTKSLIAFVCSYGIMCGIGVGITYFIPLVCAWEYFPDRKGLVTGIIVGAYGFGSFIYIQVATKIVNPDNLQTEIVSENEDSMVEFFGEDVS